MSERIQYLGAEEIRNLGILQEVNRMLLHPCGLMAEIDLRDGSIKIQDHRHDPEGCIFSEQFAEPGYKEAFEAKVVAFRALYSERAALRRDKFGWHSQPGITS